jgi:hypothetical protein
MKLLTALLVIALPCHAVVTTFAVEKTDAGAWTKILGAVGIAPVRTAEVGSIIVAGADAPEALAARALDHIVILVGNSPAAEKLGIHARAEMISVRQICDVHAPKMQVIWERAEQVHASDIPMNFQVFAAEKWKNSPVLAGKRIGRGAVLWMATSPGASGIERYPYILQALTDLGLELPARTSNLWAFFDSSYRIRADSDYLAARWRQAGVSVLQVAAWHNVEPDPVQDAYMKELIAACHRHAILVYAWLELPHVSEKFWADHPEWREKTGAGQDAQLDWRKLMNLQNPDCKAAVSKEIGALLWRFDWDGVNVAELYFESLEGASNPARFTPMNDNVRADFKRVGGFDPKLLFDPASEYSAAKNPAALRKFLDYRAGLASRMQLDWLDVVDKARAVKPYLDVVLTHIDDRFDPGIRDELGADVARSLPAIQARRSTLLVEDPATMWNLGPDRYARLGEKYAELTHDKKQLAVDINVVERYQDVYPTKKQTGVELLELVHQAAVSFNRVALYFENSLEKQDLALLPAAASTAHLKEQGANEIEVDAADSTRIAWQGPVDVDGKAWPVQSAQAVLMPVGRHEMTRGKAMAAVTLGDFNGDLQGAVVSADKTELSYSSRSRAVVIFASKVSSVAVDGATFWKADASKTVDSVMLPAGQHLATFYR